MKDNLNISIPFDLARYATCQRRLIKVYETNRLLKALDTWLVLKADSIPSLIQDWNKHKPYLLQICKVHETIFRQRLKYLQQLGLLQYDRQDIKLCSWKELGEAFHIDTDNRLTFQYKFNDQQRVHQWLIATEIQDNQNRQAYSIYKKLNKNPVNKQNLFNAILHSGGDHKQLNDPGYVITWMKALYYGDFVQVSKLHDLFIEIRPDTNRGVKGIANAWNAKHPQTVCYWKKKLVRSGIIDVSKLQIQSEERARNPLCKVLWLKQPKQTLLCLCDNIIILHPANHFKDNTTNADIPQ